MKNVIKIHGEKINGCRLLGKDIKDLIFYSRGVLTYKGHDLIFIDVKNMNIRTVRCRQKALQPVVFTSQDFDEVNKIIDDYYEYILDFSYGYLFIRDGIVGDIKITVKGFTY